MPVYIYEALDSAGKKIKGELFGGSEPEVVSLLRDDKLYPIALKEKTSRSDDSRFSGSLLLKRKVKRKHVTVFVRQFSSMLQAGVPISVILDVLVKQERNSSFREILVRISRDILAGNTLSSSLSKFDVFPNFFVSMVAVGETNGRLDAALDRVATNMEKELKLASKIRSAMTYLFILLMVSIVSCVILAFVVLPMFTRMFGEMGVKLPATTMFFLDLSKFMQEYWYVPAAMAAVFAVVFLKLLREPGLREKLDKLLLSIPLAGRIQNVILMATFCRVMSSLIESGVDVVRSLEITRNITPNFHVKNIFSEIIRLVKAGTTLSAAASRFKIFPSLVVSMTKVGEESGNLAGVLSKTADLYESETDEQLQRFAALVEPAMTLIMATAIGFIVLSIIQPMFEIYRNLGR